MRNYFKVYLSILKPALHRSTEIGKNNHSLQLPGSSQLSSGPFRCVKLRMISLRVDRKFQTYLLIKVRLYRCVLTMTNVDYAYRVASSAVLIAQSTFVMN